jgi:hypothetical protein
MTAWTLCKKLDTNTLLRYQSDCSINKTHCYRNEPALEI